MAAIPQLWANYAQLQQRLASRSSIDDHSWGMEAQLDRLLEQPGCDDETLARVGASASRKARHRARLGRIYLTVQDSAPGPEAPACARRDLRSIRAAVNDNDWRLLVAVASGYGYDELAAERRVTTGSLRARVLRQRVRLAA